MLESPRFHISLIGIELLQGVNTVAGKQPRLVGKFLCPDQILPQRVGHMARLAVLLFGEHPQQVAVVEVESAEPRRLFGLFQVPVEPAPFRLRRLFPLGRLWARIRLRMFSRE